MEEVSPNLQIVDDGLDKSSGDHTKSTMVQGESGLETPQYNGG